MVKGYYWLMDDSHKIKKLVIFQVTRAIINFYKNHLTMIEDLKTENELIMKKVERKTSKEFCDSINTFDKNKYNYIRKKTLDNGNDIVRELESVLEKLELRIK